MVCANRISWKHTTIIVAIVPIFWRQLNSMGWLCIAVAMSLIGPTPIMKHSHDRHILTIMRMFCDLGLDNIKSMLLLCNWPLLFDDISSRSAVVILSWFLAAKKREFYVATWPTRDGKASTSSLRFSISPKIELSRCGLSVAVRHTICSTESALDLKVSRGSIFIIL